MGTIKDFFDSMVEQRRRMRLAFRAAGPEAVAGFRQVLEAMMDPEMKRHFNTFKDSAS